MTKTRSLTHLESDPLSLAHGSKVYITVRCVNTVQLSGFTHIGPLVVSYKTPFTSNPKLNVIPEQRANKCVNCVNQAVTVYWDNFNDASGIYNYNFRMKSKYGRWMNWTCLQRKNFVRTQYIKDPVTVQYSFEVKADNIGKIESSSINEIINIDNRRPRVTG